MWFSNRLRHVLANQMVLGIVMILMLGSTNSVSAQGQQIEPLGRQTVGSKLADVRSLKRSENCLVEGNNADCTFTDGNGVAYVVLEDSVTKVSVSWTGRQTSVRSQLRQRP
jgi:hypothetical protein